MSLSSWIVASKASACHMRPRILYNFGIPRCRIVSCCCHPPLHIAPCHRGCSGQPDPTKSEDCNSRITMSQCDVRSSKSAQPLFFRASLAGQRCCLLSAGWLTNRTPDSEGALIPQPQVDCHKLRASASSSCRCSYTSAKFMIGTQT